MVALLRHQPSSSPRPAGHRPVELRLVVGGRPGAGPTGRRALRSGPHRGRPAHGARFRPSPAAAPHLRVVPARPALPSMVAVVVVASAVFGLFGLVRVVQGGPGAGQAPAPPAAAVVSGEVVAGAGGAAVTSPAIGPGDRVVVVAPGDSLWSIAEEVWPGRDPRPLVAALVEVNGGSELQIGQQIVIPSALID